MNARKKTPAQKVVINKCYGGFDISPEGLLWLIEKNSPLVKSMSRQEYSGNDEKWERLTNARMEPFKKGYSKDRLLSNLYKEDKVYMFEGNKERSHPDLVKLVETLKEKANSRLSKLKIVTIPAGVKYDIEEYDGLEHVAEAHRTWY